MIGYGRKSPEVTRALQAAEQILPSSGDLQDLLDNLSESRGRPLRVLTAALESKISGLLISTDRADYIAASEQASPERLAAIVCHEVAHTLLGHDHSKPVGQELVDSGLLRGIDSRLADSVIATRQAYAHTDEADAETVATYVSIELRRRVMRGGNTFFDERWR